MKRLVLEVGYERFWRLIFGSFADKIEVVEAMRCFKCDIDGFALICRIRFKDAQVPLRDLLTRGVVSHVEVLYEGTDGSLVLFLRGNYRKLMPVTFRRNQPGVVAAGPPEFLAVDRMKVSLVGKPAEVQRYLRYIESLRLPHKVLALTSLESKAESVVAKLSTKQKQALITAYGLGYYDLPRRACSQEVARHLKVDKSTLVEHLRRAERKLLAGVLAQ